MELGTNASISGSKVTGTSGSGSSAGCSTGRVNALGSNGTPDIIIVMIGINDFAYSVEVGDWDGTYIPEDGTISTVSEAYALLGYKLCNTYPEAEVFICTLLESTSGGGHNTGFDSTNLIAYNNAIRMVAESFGFKVIDMHACGMNYYNGSKYLTDGIHPNNLGADLMTSKALADISAKSILMHPVDYVPAEPHTHSYTTSVVAPTCTERGYTLHKCSCGSSYKDTYVDATGHTFVDGVCSVCGESDGTSAPSEAVWYVDVVSQIPSFSGTAQTSSSSYAYANDSDIQACTGVPINAFRMSVGASGTMSYGKVSATEYVKLGDLEVTQDTTNLQIYQLPETISLAEGELLWFIDSDDTGGFRYGSVGNDVGKFYIRITAAGTSFSTSSSCLGVDIGYIAE